MNHKEEYNKDIDMSHSYQHNVYVKTMRFKESGFMYCGHHHTYDHVTLVASGKVRVKFGAVPEGNLPEEEKEYTGSSMFVTRSYREHEITALEDKTVCSCIHAIKTTDNEIVDPDFLIDTLWSTNKGELFRMVSDRYEKDMIPFIPRRHI